MDNRTGSLGFNVDLEKRPRRFKIGYVAQPFDNSAPPDPGGSLGIWNWEVSKRLTGSAHVVVCAPRRSGQPGGEQWEGVDFVRIPLTADLRLLALRSRKSSVRDAGRPLFASSIYYCFYAIRAAKVLRANACDVVHIHNFSQFVPIVRLLNPAAKIVLHMSCDWLAQLDRTLIEPRLKRAEAIIGSSDAVTERIRKRFPNHAHRCMTVFNGVDTEGFSPGESTGPPGQRVVYLGRISPEKGLHVLFDAFEHVVQRRPDVRLEIIGGAHVPPKDFIVGVCDDPIVKRLSRFYGEESYLRVLQRRLPGGLEKSVCFGGELRHEELSRRLRGAAVLVQPSLVESFGMPVAEAMASGVPVVASRVGGLPELVVDERTGLLVEPDCPIALAHALLRLLENPDLARTMGRAGRLRAERLFSWDRIVDKLQQLYAGLCSGNSASVASIRSLNGAL